MIAFLILLSFTIQTFALDLTLNPCSQRECFVHSIRDPDLSSITISFYSSHPIDFRLVPTFMHTHHLIAIQTVIPSSDAFNRAKNAFRTFNDDVNQCLRHTNLTWWQRLWRWVRRRPMVRSEQCTIVSKTAPTVRSMIASKFNRNQDEKVYLATQRDWVVPEHEYTVLNENETECEEGLGFCFQIKMKRRVVARVVQTKDDVSDAVRFVIATKMGRRVLGFNREYVKLTEPTYRNGENAWVTKDEHGWERLVLESSFFKDAMFRDFDHSFTDKTLTLRNDVSKNEIKFRLEEKKEDLGFSYKTTFMILDDGQLVHQDITKVTTLEKMSTKLVGSPDRIILDSGKLTLFYFNNEEMLTLNAALGNMSCAQAAQTHIFTSQQFNRPLWSMLLSHPLCSDQKQLDVIGIAAMKRKWPEAFKMIQPRMTQDARAFARLNNQIVLQQLSHQPSHRNSTLSFLDDEEEEEEFRELAPYFMTYLNLKKIAASCLQFSSCSRKNPDTWMLPYAWIDIQDQFGETKLMKSAYSADVETVRYLLSRGANPYLRDNNKFTALEMVELLLSVPKAHVPLYDTFAEIKEVLMEKAPSSLRGNLHRHRKPYEISEELEQELFHQSALIGRTYLVEVILRRQKISVHHADRNGETALLKAVREGHHKVVEKILQYLPDGETLIFKVDAFGLNELKWAWSFLEHLEQIPSRGNVELMTFIYRYKQIKNMLEEKLQGSNLDVQPVNLNNLYFDAITKGRNDITQLLLTRFVSQNYENQNRETPLIAAIKENQADIVGLMIAQQGVWFNHKDKEGLTPLMHAASSTADVLNRFLAELLIKMKGMPRQLERVLNEKHVGTGKTAVAFIVEKQRIDLLHVIKNSKLPFKFIERDNNGNTPLMNAINDQNSDEIIQNLFRVPSTEEITNNHGLLPLSLLVTKGRCYLSLNILRSLPDQQQTIYASHQDISGRTLLMESIEHGCRDLVTYLLESQVLPRRLLLNQRDKLNGKTPLLFAIEKKNDGIVNMILRIAEECGIRYEVFKVSDYQAQTVLDYARKSNNLNIRNNLEDLNNRLNSERRSSSQKRQDDLPSNTSETPEHTKGQENETNVEAENGNGSDRDRHFRNVVIGGLSTTLFTALAITDFVCTGGVFNGIYIAVGSTAAAGGFAAFAGYSYERAHNS